jgi:hypothetical protein
MEVPSHELYRQPFGSFTPLELLAAVKYNLRFNPCKRLYQEVVRRDLWKIALGYPLLIKHASYFLGIVLDAPYPNQDELNRQCQRIIAEGVTEYLSTRIEQASAAAAKISMVSMFQRFPNVSVPNTITVFPRKRKGAALKMTCAPALSPQQGNQVRGFCEGSEREGEGEKAIMTDDAANRRTVRKYLLSGEQLQDGPVLTTRAYPQRTLVIAKDSAGRILWAFFFTGANRLYRIDGAYLIALENEEAKAKAKAEK